MIDDLLLTERDVRELLEKHGIVVSTGQLIAIYEDLRVIVDHAYAEGAEERGEDLDEDY